MSFDLTVVALSGVFFFSSLSNRELPQFDRVNPLHGGGVAKLEKAKFGICGPANVVVVVAVVSPKMSKSSQDGEESIFQPHNI